MLSNVISRPMWRQQWRHTRPCQNRCMWYVISVSMQVYAWNPKKNSKWSLFAYGWVNMAVGAMQWPCTMPAQKVNPVTCVACLWWRQLILGLVNEGNYFSFCRWCTCEVSLCEIYGYISGFQRPEQHREIWLRQRTVKIGLTIFLGLTSAFIQWFSLKSHLQGIYVRRRVLQTNFSNALMSSPIWHEREMPYLEHNW